MVPLLLPVLRGATAAGNPPLPRRCCLPAPAAPQMASRHTNLDVHDWQGSFQGRPAAFKMTSVIGHVLSIDFPGGSRRWGQVHAGQLGGRWG